MATSSTSSNTLKKTVKDFKFIKEIGDGSYSKVWLVIEIATNRELALKEVRKDLITKLKKAPQVLRERNILAQLNDCSYTIKLHCTFQNEENLYFGLTYCSNGDLLQYITDAGHFEIDIVRFYSAELIEALEQLHIHRIIHRDLKPENILLTDDMHIQLADFGSAVIIDNNEISHVNNNEEKKSVERRNSFVGTAQFVAPEILRCGPIHIGSDFWSLGCIIYQMVTGKHLFHGYHEYDIMNAVARAAYKLPDDFPDVIGDLIHKLIRLQPSERLGTEEAGGIEKLKEHPFFCDTKWGDLLNQKSPLEANVKLCSRPINTNDDMKTKNPEN
ncbi:unnamed protein product [Adineta steineri]|uniref:non-specific serine/threonine protein kinase n=1 Tax=Adineta steineri TaxID=433720 RepID=A0A815Q3G7_9BILA|nr:unnamed protein product [Adineta steineri]